MIHSATQAWGNVLQQRDLIRNLKKNNEKLSANLIETQETLIKVKLSQLVECKDEQFHGISTAVQLSVKDSMQKEITSYSKILQSPGLCSDTQQTITEGEGVSPSPCQPALTTTYYIQVPLPQVCWLMT